ncbi:VanZ like family protein [Thalassobacillus cyri]|uniref:VanZ like family protein n=1 Tax=Thalassobacillus cyri TaxID=571932 RepID=A0A1H4DVL4_9BACI|nr:VanZ family protein [Thalassobacillus cyri]SEA76548.1 VanZ like family protein [Thalassobacillus cyri]
MKYWILPVLWMAVIFYSSSQPYQEQNIKPFLSDTIDLSFLNPLLESVQFTYHNSEVSLAALGTEGLVEFFIRKGAHITVFLILTLLFYYALTKTSQLSLNVRLAVAWLMTVMYAITDEWHQGLTPNRTPYIGDVILDATGAIIAVAILFLLSRKKNPGK